MNMNKPTKISELNITINNMRNFLAEHNSKSEIAQENISKLKQMYRKYKTEEYQKNKIFENNKQCLILENISN